MILGLDLDHVTVDFLNVCAEYFGYAPEDVQAWNDMFEAANLGPHAFFEEVREAGLFASARPVKWAVLAITWLMGKGHEVHFITHRPEWAEAETRKWVADYFSDFPEDRIHIVHGNKADVRCDVYLDDSPHVLADLYEVGAYTVRFVHPWNEGAPCDASVENWLQFVRLIEELENG